MQRFNILILTIPLINAFLVFGIERLTLNKKLNVIKLTTYFLFGMATIVVSHFVSPVIMKYLPDIGLILGSLSLSQRHAPPWLIVLYSILLIDLANYLLHRAMHLKIFWRLHQVHHSDTRVCGLTPLIHHPLEMVLSTAFLLFFYFVLDIPVVVILGYVLFFSLYDALLHSHLKLNKKFESLLGLIFITPTLHRSHHSIEMKESNLNFGSLFSIWDRLFGTHKKISKVDAYGVKEQKAKELHLKNLLQMPFTN